MQKIKCKIVLFFCARRGSWSAAVSSRRYPRIEADRFDDSSSSAAEQLILRYSENATGDNPKGLNQKEFAEFLQRTTSHSSEYLASLVGECMAPAGNCSWKLECPGIPEIYSRLSVEGLLPAVALIQALPVAFNTLTSENCSDAAKEIMYHVKKAVKPTMAEGNETSCEVDHLSRCFENAQKLYYGGSNRTKCYCPLPCIQSNYKAAVTTASFRRTQFFQELQRKHNRGAESHGDYEKESTPLESAEHAFVEDLVKNNRVVVFSKSQCPHCDDSKTLLSNMESNKYSSPYSQLCTPSNLCKVVINPKLDL
ncbi:hypothetical protein Btru_075034 [Bulinus truncatus]|nr:hypothetical protein Btru_075034 [Bulinus truncatus]